MPVADQVNLVKPSHPLGDRVSVFGAGGKTTLAKAIARRRDLELIEIDWIRWMPEWMLRTDDEVEKIVTERMESSPRGWVTDHNERFLLQRAESVILLELPFRTIFWRRLTRSIHRAWTKEPVCGGNTETFRQHFTSRESAIWEAWQRRKRYGRIYETVSGQIPPGVDLYRIRTPRELDRFYQFHDLSRKAPLTD
ncbi:MAG: hypothetical protein FI707_07250 [SAR202 cluster bacterium]|nr:hypothetical protein [Chloroflexota bacterium]MQG59171.1 hypothetical protein [SAR202 cluster bacterium]MQG68573.1 hypothetical protein [SAR202 cluster bacterium]HAL48658.1 hypothetical protein [Dehalococcoidia bacterium]|tara:strand:+ start:3907 stop:4491 length:585 start_codon:yes stop_codon:yes gene_type:complete